MLKIGIMTNKRFLAEKQFPSKIAVGLVEVQKHSHENIVQWLFENIGALDVALKS
jgi:hypothetical protein